ncbi:MAG: AzlC family ABC transporter permease [Actinomycetota bacterium]|nr:AzlC family ABC transporter permease [Actinomycetota bacterium]
MSKSGEKSGDDFADGGTRAVLLAAAPLAAAIFVFGTIYGAAAVTIASPAKTILSSVVIFSGAVQFALVGLLLTGGSPFAAVATAVMLNARNLLLGAAMRARLRDSRGKRALLAWWLSDEATGLALAARSAPGRVLFVAGVSFYLAWIVGTIIGVVGSSLAPLEGLAAAVFPVLFVGLAALSAHTRSDVIRTLVAAAISLGLAIALPQGRGIVPAIAAVAVAVPFAKR